MAVLYKWETANSIIKDYQSATANNPVATEKKIILLPLAVRRELKEADFEPGRFSLTQQYFEHLLRQDLFLAQDSLQRTFYDAISHKHKRILWNVMIVISQLPYGRMEPWAAFMAITATRLPFLDIQELGIRCFENWENKSACKFLAGCHFAENWLQEYANEVYDFVMEEGIQDVLYEKDFPWEMAWGSSNITSNLEGYSSRYRNNRNENRQEHPIYLGGEYARGY